MAYFRALTSGSGGGSAINPTILQHYSQATYSETIPLDSSKHYIVESVYIRTLGETRIISIENNTITPLLDEQSSLTYKPEFAISNGNLTINVSQGSYRFAVTVFQLD